MNLYFYKTSLPAQINTANNIQNHFSNTNDLLNLLHPIILHLRYVNDPRKIIESLPHFADNLSLTDFLNVMATIHFNTDYIKTNLNEVSEQMLPCLFIPNNNGNAIAIIEKNERGLRIINANGEEEMIYNYSTKGTMFYFSPMKSKDANRITSYQSFIEHLEPFRHLFYQILFINLIVNIFALAPPIFIMIVYDKVIPNESFNLLTSFVFGALVFIASSQILKIARIKILAYISARMEKIIGENVIRHILYLSSSYTETNSVGNQISRILDFSNIREFFTSPIAMTLCELPFTIIFIFFIYIFAGIIAIVPIILAAIFAILYTFTNNIVEKNIRQFSKENNDKQAILLETFTKYNNIKEIGRKEYWKNKYHYQTVNLAVCSFKNSFFTEILSEFSEMLMMVAALAILAMGTFLVIDNQMSMGALIATMLLTWKVLNPIKFFFSSMPQLDQIKNSIAQINKLFKIQTEQAQNQAPAVLSHDGVEIEFNRVSFKYKPNLPPAILGASFVVNKKDLVCIVGKSGAGKSTLLRLIMGLYKPQTGIISLDKVNISQLNPIHLRREIAYMPEDNQIFYGTIKQNLQFTDILASDYDIEIACRMANLYDEIMQLPDKFDTKIGDQSTKWLSASFMQKLILSRAFIKSSPIRLFDEPTNHLEFIDDARFLDILQWMKQDSTIFLVTHRPSHLKRADKIIYLEDGQINMFGETQRVLQKLPINLI